jgi:transcriptional regulator with XRE-family HTH domain
MEADDVKRIRAKLGITQAELARRIGGVSRRTVEGWEQGLRGIGEVNAEKLRKLEGGINNG